MQVQKRMASYANQSVPTRPQKRLAERLLEERGNSRNKAAGRARRIPRLDQSERKRRPGLIRSRPCRARPAQHQGHHHRIRPAAKRHRAARRHRRQGRHGLVLRTSASKSRRLDPKTGKVTEITLPELKTGCRRARSASDPDPDGNLWFGMMYQGAVAQARSATLEEFETFSLPPDMNKDMTQVNMVAPQVRRRRRQGLVAEQRLRRASPPRPQDRGNRNVRARSRIRRQARTTTSTTSSRTRRTTSTSPISPSSTSAGSTPRPGRSTLYRTADQGIGAAPRHDGCAGPHLVRPISRQQDRHVRHQDREVQGMGDADDVLRAL